MNYFRDFTTTEGHVPLGRAVDDDAPMPMRQEIIDLIFYIANASGGALNPNRLHQSASQSVGLQPAANPYGGPQYALGRDIQRVPWMRVYDLVVRLWPEFAAIGAAHEYRNGVNRILAGYGVAWDLGEDGRLRRAVHPVLQAALDQALGALNEPRFAHALLLFNSARDAFDDRPRRDRDAVANAFDALEAVAKVVRAQPAATFGAVLQEMRANNVGNPQVVGILEAINTLRNRNFGHGVPFTLTAAEIDFAFGQIVSAIVLLAR